MTPRPLVIVESPYAARPWVTLDPGLVGSFKTYVEKGLGYLPPARYWAAAWAKHDVQENTEYARACLLDSVKRGEAPIASHLLYPRILDDGIPDERATGIACGLAWRAASHFAVFYVDRGWSRGMVAARDLYTAERRAFVERSIR